MCGIIGFLGNGDAVDKVLNGLKTLEYRGYDGAGLGFINGDAVKIIRQVGVVDRLIEKVGKAVDVPLAIGHTRWAAVGGVSEKNCHPQLSHDYKVAVVHNGVIANYTKLRKELEAEGVEFVAETDTEVIPNLIAKYVAQGMSLFESVINASKKLSESYAFLAISATEPETIVASRRGSQPLTIGTSADGEFYFSSDVSAVANKCINVFALENGESVVAKQGADLCFFRGAKSIEKKPITVSQKFVEVSKNGFETFMEKEIFEIPDVVSWYKDLKLKPVRKLENAKTVHIAGCGTSYHAGLLIANLFEQVGKRAKVYVASEMANAKPNIESGDVGIVISQSGETADTLGALQFMRKSGMYTIGICNVEGSSISRYVDKCFHTNAGIEVAVASTKAYIAQVLIGMHLVAQFSKVSAAQPLYKCGLLDTNLALGVEEVLKKREAIKDKAIEYSDIQRIFFLGKGFDAVTALESALKVKEITYKHCEGFPANEIKHGPLSMVDSETLCIIFGSGEKIENVAAEVSARGSKIWNIDEGHPLLNVVAAQLFALYMALELGLPADKPRNLAKSVTV